MRWRQALSGGLRGGALGLAAQQAALHHLRLLRQVPVGRAEQEGVEAAVMLDGADGVGGEAHTDGGAEDVGQQRGLLQVRQEAAAALVVGVADVVARLHALAGELAATRHGGDP